MNEFTEKKGKDALPENTVKHVKESLEKLGVVLKHEFISSDVEGCYTTRTYIDGPLNFIGANGKGATEEYCIASGYAEFIERAQNKLLGLYSFYGPKWPLQTCCEQGDFRMMGFDELAEEENGYLNYSLNQLAKTLDKCPESMEPFDMAKLLFKRTYPQVLNKLPATPYYSVAEKRYVWMSYYVNQLSSMSNGMAAGNTVEEAVVQAMSEIIERASLSEIIKKQLVPPDIPKEVLRRYPHIVNIIDSIEKSGQYKVLVKDASLGRNYPAVCGIIIDTKHQTFGIRFGACPDMGIALERVFTESLQGKKLFQAAALSWLHLDESYVQSLQNCFNLVKTGQGATGTNFLEAEPSWEFSEWQWQPEIGNKGLAKQMVQLAISEGHPVYIEDLSFLGIPTVFIVSCGLSEIIPCTKERMKQDKLRTDVANYIRHCDRLTEQEVRKVLTYALQYRNSAVENSINYMYQLPFQRVFPGPFELDMLAACCCYYLGDYKSALLCFQKILSVQEAGSEQYQYIIAAAKYLEGLCAGTDLKKLRQAMEILCGRELTEKVYEDFSDPKSIFTRFYPVCPEFDCDNCKNTDCRYPQVCELYRKLWEAQQENSTACKTLHKLFGEEDV